MAKLHDSTTLYNVAKLYDSLPLSTPDTIRLLNIDQGNDGDLKGFMNTVRLEHKPKFDALSYVRESMLSRIIKFDGGTISIGENCYQALCHLRKVKSLTIWIDIVCKRDNEKQHHVRLMSSIFSQAANAYLWLGTADSNADSAMDFMATGGLRHYFYKDGDPSEGEVTKPMECFRRLYCWPYILSIEKSNITLHTKEGKRVVTPLALERLLGTGWNTRIETFAETISATNPIVVCRDKQVRWTYFAMTLMYLYQSKALKTYNIDSWYRLVLSKEFLQPGVLRKYIDLLRQLSHRRNNITNLKVWLSLIYFITLLVIVGIKISRSYWWCWFIGFTVAINLFAGDNNLSLGKGGTGKPLSEDDLKQALHYAMREKGADNSKDLYWAMQSIFKQDEVVRTSKQAYQALTKCLIDVAGAVSLLELASQNRISTPTWVPDWSDIGTVGILHTSAYAAGFNAMKTDIPRKLAVKFGENSLTVPGRRMHKIENVYALQPTQAEYDISEHEIHVHNYRIIHAMITAGKGKHSYKPVNKELRKLKLIPELLVFLDKLWSDTTRPAELPAKHLFDYVQHFKDVEIDISNPTIAVDTSFWPPWSKSVTEKFRVHIALCRLMIKHHCAFFKAVHDEVRQYYGICLTIAQKGDEIVLVQDVTIPIIMRVSMNHQIVCPSSVFGIMQGELWKKGKASDKRVLDPYEHEITIV